MIQAATGAHRSARLYGSLLVALLVLAAAFTPTAHAATPANSAQPQPTTAQSATSQSVAGVQRDSEVQNTNGAAVLEAFDKQQEQRVRQASELSDHGKRLIMFSLAVPLFILLLITGGLGIATGVYGKRLFIQHMVFAGLTITLALAHAIVGLVWFYPF